MKRFLMTGLIVLVFAAALQGADIYIKVVDGSTVIKELNEKDGYRGEIMWCRKIDKNDNKTGYGVGVRLMTNVCHQCGDKIPSMEIRKNEDFICLCTTCSTHLAMLNDGKIKDSIENYLLGNVV